MTRRASRRAFLAGVSCSAAALAGCSSKETVGGLSGPTFDSIVDDVAVGAREVVLQLASSDVSKAVLIGPDGTAFDSQSLEPGVTTVRFPILELDLRLFQSSHYTPGEYEIVVVTEDGEFTTALSLVPELQVTAVEQYRDGDSPAELAKIAVTVQNLGTGPTWIYDIAFQESPNYTADGSVSENPAIPYVFHPSTAEDLILSANEEARYVAGSYPLASTASDFACDTGFSEFRAQIAVADGTTLTADIVPTVSGTPVSLGFTGETACTHVDIDWTTEGVSSE